MAESTQQPQSTDRSSSSRPPADASRPSEQPVDTPRIPKLSPALLYGLIASMCLIFLTMGTYFGGPKVFVGDIGFLRYPIILLLSVLAVLKEKRDKGGQLEFRAAQRTGFTVSALALTVQGLFTSLLVMMSKPAFRDGLIQAVADRTASAYRAIGTREEDITRMLADQKDTNPFSFSSTLQGLAYNYIVFFLISLLIAAILKTRRGISPQNRTIK